MNSNIKYFKVKPFIYILFIIIILYILRMIYNTFQIQMALSVIFL